MTTKLPPLIVKPYAMLQYPYSRMEGMKLLRIIEQAARVSHRSEEDMNEHSWDRFIENVVLKRGDWSVVEHAIASVEMCVDRGITHEIVRHRLFSFTQESTRFVNYGKSAHPPEFVKPYLITDEHYDLWYQGIVHALDAYNALLGAGYAPQTARSVLPNALASRIVITGNLRQWRHFLLMRTTKETHPQMREVTKPLLNQFKSYVPLLFDDVVPEERQITALAKPR